MISREDTWHPRYGVSPGYGISLQDGFQDTFTATATAALEWGAFPYAKGVIDNHFKYYVQANGGSTYRAEEVAVSSRMLTILALYNSYTGDAAFLASHFTKARALGAWLLNRCVVGLLRHDHLLAVAVTSCSCRCVSQHVTWHHHRHTPI